MTQEMATIKKNFFEKIFLKEKNKSKKKVTINPLLTLSLEERSITRVVLHTHDCYNDGLHFVGTEELFFRQCPVCGDRIHLLSPLLRFYKMETELSSMQMLTACVSRACSLEIYGYKRLLENTMTFFNNQIPERFKKDILRGGYFSFLYNKENITNFSILCDILFNINCCFFWNDKIVLI